jgi:multiple sugar transport system substrate-binding protein
MKKKSIVLFLCLLMILTPLLTVSAKGQEEAGAAAPKIAEITMSSWLSLQDVSKEMMDEIVSRFNAENEGITVTMQGVPFENQLQQTLIAAAGKNLPDIMHLVPSWVPPLHAQNALADLRPLLTESEYQDIQSGYREGATIDGKLTYVPLQNGSIVVLGNKNLLKQAGLTEEIPETWAEFKTAVDKISSLGKDIYGFGARTAKASNSAFWFIPVLEGHNGTFEDADGNINFNTPGTVEAMKWYNKLGTQNQTPIGMGIPEVRTLFAQGKVGFIFDGPWMKGVMRSITGRGEAADDEYIVGLMPKDADGNRFTIANDHSLAIAQSSPNKEAAMDFIRFLTMTEEITKFHYEKMGAIPGYTSLLADPIYQNDPYTKVFVESAMFASANPSKNPSYTAALEELAAGMQDVLLGGDPVKVTAEMDKNMADIYK